MSAEFSVGPSGVTLSLPGEVLVVEAWGHSTFRVRASPDGEFSILDDALVATAATPATVRVDGGEARVTNGDLTAIVEKSGRVHFETARGDTFGEEWFDHREPPLIPFRRYQPIGDGSFEVTATFGSDESERIYGLGQHATGRLNLKGRVVDLLQRNTQVSIPVIVSSRGYGMFWNSAAVGRVEFASNHTRWVSARGKQVDYFVYSAATPAGILERYHDLCGFSPSMPEWATGFWQSKSYYTSQEEVLAVARDHLARGLPLASIFVDYMHWPHMGDWNWDRELWPDPAGMVAELSSAGVQVMVSVWPHVSPRSENFDYLRRHGLLVKDPDGGLAVFSYADRDSPDGADLHLLDLSNPVAQDFLWSRVRRNYYDIGVRAFWLDACEPEVAQFGPGLRETDLRYERGHGAEVSSLFPFFDASAFRRGLDAVDDTQTMLVARSAWAGTQRLGVAVWSGDIQSTWQALADQVAAGLNMMASGIDWWTSDIGGFFDSDIESPDFRELLVRWFQFALVWPVVRLHGNRNADFYNGGYFTSGDANEVWSFGDEAYGILSGLLGFRERLRPYLARVLEVASHAGTPPIRPLWFEYPDDATAVTVDDQFVLGPDLLVAPIVSPGVTARTVYLPAGARWRDVWTDEIHEGGTSVKVIAPLDTVPVFERVGAGIGVDRTWFTPLSGTAVRDE